MITITSPSVKQSPEYPRELGYTAVFQINNLGQARAILLFAGNPVEYATEFQPTNLDNLTVPGVLEVAESYFLGDNDPLKDNPTSGQIVLDVYDLLKARLPNPDFEADRFSEWETVVVNPTVTE